MCLHACTNVNFELQCYNDLKMCHIQPYSNVELYEFMQNAHAVTITVHFQLVYYVYMYTEEDV